MDDHHTHKHAEEDERGKQNEDDGERSAQSKLPLVQLLLQVCPAINLLGQGRACRVPRPSRVGLLLTYLRGALTLLEGGCFFLPINPSAASPNPLTLVHTW